jgi:coproporphyrinogen III oxidase-like Fe-S oxidoreductase
LTAEQQVMEAVYLGLRTTEGIRTDQFNETFEQDFLEVFGSAVSEFEKMGLLVVTPDRCFLTHRGMLLLDSIVDRMIGISLLKA